ncbi:MAG: MBL fold metallo-hydrolase [Candidatus Nomurabacteria bacterium]|jgi:L-ascorbate metabolism protein UlaG (beta-lactamase superfamily)|nr:MBL fold metallo-hydrolase [Candidatus Nomurabacteria bacterium]
MEIEYRGANCVVIKNKKISIVVDPTENVSAKEMKNPETVIIATQKSFVPSKRDIQNFIIETPGEYERNDVSVQGIPVRAHVDADEQARNATMYSVETDGLRIVVIGHTTAPLDDEDLENLGMIDVVVIPVGGGGYTLDARDAATIVRQISPKVVIPTHYADTHVKYEVPQESVEDFVKELASAHKKESSFKAKDLPEGLTIFELTRTS